MGGRGKCWGVQDSSEGGLTEEGEGSCSVLHIRQTLVHGTHVFRMKVRGVEQGMQVQGTGGREQGQSQGGSICRCPAAGEYQVETM